jgi:hypothetical protein
LAGRHGIPALEGSAESVRPNRTESSGGRSSRACSPQAVLVPEVPTLVAVIARYDDVREVVGTAFAPGPDVIDCRLIEADPAAAPMAGHWHRQGAAADFLPEAYL